VEAVVVMVEADMVAAAAISNRAVAVGSRRSLVWH